MKWNELIKSKMKKSGITQSDLAELMDVAQGTIGRYLNEQREPSLECIAEMMGHVGLSHMALLPDGSVVSDKFDAGVQTVSTENSAPLLSKNLLSIMKLKGVTQAELAKVSGVSQVAISHLISGKSLSSRKLPDIAKGLGVTTEALTSEHGALLEEAKPLVYYYPLISYVDAGNFSGVIESSANYEYYPVSKACNPSTFALRIKGESMEPRFMDGDIIFVDPEQNYSSGDYVVARLNGSDEATFKQYREVEGKKYLHALNSELPLDIRFQQLTNDSGIVGKVVAVYKEF